MNKETNENFPIVLSFYSYRGGTGKSTIASNIALISAKKYKTIIVDLDLYSPQLTYIFDIENEYYINDYLRDSLFTPKSDRTKIELSNVICTSTENNLDLILSNPKITLSDNTILHDDVTTRKLFPCFQHMVELLKTEYNVIILDCPGELNYYTLNSIAVSNRAISVNIPTIANVKGMMELLSIFSTALQGKSSDVMLTMVSTRHSKVKKSRLERWKLGFEELGVENLLIFDYSENTSYRHQFEDDFFYFPEEIEYQKLEKYLEKILE